LLPWTWFGEHPKFWEVKHPLKLWTNTFSPIRETFWHQNLVVPFEKSALALARLAQLSNSFRMYVQSQSYKPGPRTLEKGQPSPKWEVEGGEVSWGLIRWKAYYHFVTICDLWLPQPWYVYFKMSRRCVGTLWTNALDMSLQTLPSNLHVVKITFDKHHNSTIRWWNLHFDRKHQSFLQILHCSALLNTVPSYNQPELELGSKL
jgi:hypothetical protein